MKVCFTGPKELNSTDVFVTDLLTKVTTWPADPAPDGPTTPVETNETLSNSTNGFNATLSGPGDDDKTWCLESSDLGAFMDAFNQTD